MFTHLSIIDSCSHATTAELSTCERDHIACKAKKNPQSDPLPKKLAREKIFADHVSDKKLVSRL